MPFSGPQSVFEMFRTRHILRCSMSFFRDSGSTKVKVRGYLIVEQGVNKGGKEALGLS